MRKLFVPDTVYDSEASVVYAYPWADYRVECEGGWMIFESYDDYKTWKATR